MHDERGSLELAVNRTRAARSARTPSDARTRTRAVPITPAIVFRSTDHPARHKHGHPTILPIFPIQLSLSFPSSPVPSLSAPSPLVAL